MDKKPKTTQSNAGRNLIRFDWAMKRLLRNKADYVVLEGFLSVLLEQNIKITSVCESESNQQAADDKFNRVDIMVENDAKELFIIEIQSCHEFDYFFRMLYGVSKAIVDHIKVGEDYTHVRKVYHINIVYFTLGEGSDYVYQGNTSFKGIHSGDELKLNRKQREYFGRKSIHELFPEYYILKVKDFDDCAKDNLDQWIYYLKNDAILDGFNAPGLPEARKRLQVDHLSPKDRAVYDAHLMQLSHNFSMIDSARLEGKYEERYKLEKVIAQKDEALAEKDEALAQKDETIAQKDEALAQKDETIAQKDEALAEMEKRIEELLGVRH